MLQKTKNVGNLLREIFGHFASISFIRRVTLVPECWFGSISDRQEIIWLLLAEQLMHKKSGAVNGAGWQAAVRSERAATESIKAAERKSHSVDDKEAFELRQDGLAVMVKEASGGADVGPSCFDNIMQINL